MKEDTVNVIGVYHSIKHPGFPEVLQYIEDTVAKGQRIAIESPWSLERIEKEGAGHPNANYRFLFEIYAAMRRKCAEIIPVEDEELYRFSGYLWQWYMFEEPAMLDADERWHELSIKRGIRHIQLAYQQACERLFTGMSHAYELQMMGYVDVRTVPNNPEDAKRYKKKMQPYIERFGVDLATEEWKQKRYPLVSNMELESE